MLIKVDFEKSYDTIEWNVILATLKLMNFPRMWISWVEKCITSPSYSSIKGHPAHWITSQRVLRWGDPISLFPFLLVSQNLIAILNQALNIRMIPIFYYRLIFGFNHHMFTNDFIIITKDSRAVAKNCKHCQKYIVYVSVGLTTELF